MVTQLPEIEDLPCMYSGMIPIDETEKDEVFYILVKADGDNPEKKPLVIWFNESPGKSSLVSLFTEIGPIKLNKNKFYIDETNSWNRLCNILFIEQPLGTGFSRNLINKEKIPKNEDELSTQFLKFLSHFLFKHHPGLRDTDIYLIGENYSGKYIPSIAKKIIEHNQDHQAPNKINLKKIAIGNGLFDAKFQRSARKDLAKGVHILSEFDDEAQYDLLVKDCEFSLSSKHSEKMQESLKKCSKILNYVQELSGDVNEYDIRKTQTSYEKDINYLQHYLNRRDVLIGLNLIKNTTNNATNTSEPEILNIWNFTNNDVVSAMEADVNLNSSIINIEYILDKSDVPIFIYAGQFDLVDGPQGIERALHTLNHRNAENFRLASRELWQVEDDKGIHTVGYIKKFKNLIFLTMRNAGHYTPKDSIYSSMNLLEHIFDISKQYCGGSTNSTTCQMWPKKCASMKHCNGNGICNEQTAGKCICNIDFYGPACTHKPEELDSGTTLRISPRESKIFTLKHHEVDVFLEIDSTDKKLLMSLVDKNDHESILNSEKHEYTNLLENFQSSTYIKKNKLDGYLLVLTNLEFGNEIEVEIHINNYSKIQYFIIFRFL
jgi:carboxypeptidase C (cathepsin A)